ncbi:Spo0B C-terminal domain-containing protein [Evansella sp. AB-rgal1]|uniref:Spo0B C-terminal domain-containing protein n=1 Tax=Evansella sp. AB-rgal1 TaxID=3242696 RepID=UPI00359E0BA6
MNRDWDVVDVLRHYRHDWLNKLQLIKGNLDIGRVEKVEHIIRDVIQQSKNESDLSNMNMDKLAKRLLTFNWENHPYLLTFELVDGTADWSLLEERVLRIMNEIVSILDEHSVYGNDNRLLIIFKDVRNFELELDFDGYLKIDDKLEETFLNLRETYQGITKMEWDGHGCYVRVAFHD